MTQEQPNKPFAVKAVEGAGRARNAVANGAKNFSWKGAATVTGKVAGQAGGAIIGLDSWKKLGKQVPRIFKNKQERKPDRQISMLGFSEHVLEQYDAELQSQEKSKLGNVVSNGAGAVLLSVVTGVGIKFGGAMAVLTGPVAAGRWAATGTHAADLRAIKSERKQVQNFRNSIQAARELAKDAGKEELFNQRLELLTETNRQITAKNAYSREKEDFLELDSSISPEELFNRVTGSEAGRFIDKNFSPKDATRGGTVVTRITADLADTEVSPANPTLSASVDDKAHRDRAYPTNNRQPFSSAVTKGTMAKLFEVSDEEIQSFVEELTADTAVDTEHQASA